MYSCVNKHLERQLVLASRYRPIITPSPFPAELTWKYNYVDLYSGVIFVRFCFLSKNFVPVTVKNRVRVRVSSRVRVRVRVRV